MPDYAIKFRRTGGPEVLERVDLGSLVPAAGELQLRHTAVGLNFIDVYFRSGLYPAKLPSGLGIEAAGIVEAVGPGVEGFAVGDRVAYAGGPLGAYASARTIGADELVHLPDDVSDEVAAAVLLKGMTAAFLADRCARVAPGQSALVHAAAGGVGSILVPWLVARGGEVIAHGGSPEKAEQARAAGAALGLSCSMDELAAAVRSHTNGAGVSVVFDGVGAASWQASLDSVARRGLIVSYGNASGPVPPFDPLALMRAGSIFVTRPTLADYTRTPAERIDLASSLFDMIRTHGLGASIGQTFPLLDAAEAHRRLEARQTVGSTILTI